MASEIISCPVAQESPFLNFISSCGNGIPTDLILSYISEDYDESYDNLFNLRLVCSATKNWIDCLRPAQLLTHFPELKISFTLCRKNLKEFMKNPPNFNVSCLELNNTEYLCEDGNNLSIEESVLIEQFKNYWHQRLESLEVKHLTKEVMNDFVLCPNLRKFRCVSMEKFCPRISQLTNLSVESMKWFSAGGDPFYTGVLLAQKLKRLEIPASYRSFEGLASLINSRKYDKDFELTVKFGFLATGESDMPIDLIKNFVSAVANSHSKIVLLRVNEFVIQKALEVTPEDDQTKQRFFWRIEWIEFNLYDSTGWFADLLRQNAFPNLKRYEEGPLYLLNSAVGNFKEEDEIIAPSTLTHLIVTSAILFKNNLPKNLVFLELNISFFSGRLLQTLFVKIGRDCPLLEEFKVAYYCRTPLTQQAVNPILMSSEHFSHLKSLSCTMHCRVEDNLESMEIFLMGILQINTLKIQYFSLEANLKTSHFPVMLGSGVLSAMLASPLAHQSLLNFKHKNVVFVEEAPELLEELGIQMDDNLEKFNKEFGRKGKYYCKPASYK